MINHKNRLNLRMNLSKLMHKNLNLKWKNNKVSHKKIINSSCRVKKLEESPKDHNSQIIHKEFPKNIKELSTQETKKLVN
jgi:hypothetical protein